MKRAPSFDKPLDEMTVKEALQHDAAEIAFRNSVIIDPAPMPMIPITPIVIGKKAIKGAKKVLNDIKKAF